MNSLPRTRMLPVPAHRQKNEQYNNVYLNHPTAEELFPLQEKKIDFHSIDMAISFCVYRVINEGNSPKGARGILPLSDTSTSGTIPWIGS